MELWGFSENSTCAENIWQQNGVRPEIYDDFWSQRGTKTPFSTGDLKDRKRLGKIGGIENSDFARSRAETYSGLPSYFCDYSNTATCNNCLFGEVQGRQFSQIMDSA